MHVVKLLALSVMTRFKLVLSIMKEALVLQS